MEDIAARLERHTDRGGGHHLWTGATRADGLGMVKVDGRVATVGRVVWELAHGPLADGARVLACPDERTCVRLDHLRLDRDPSVSPRDRGRRGPYGGGSKRRVRPGVWKLTITSGRFDDGTPRRSYRTVRAESATEASRLLADFAAEVRGAAPPTTSRELRDVTVDAAVGLYLDHLLDEKGRTEKTVGDYRLLHDRWFRSEGLGGTRRTTRSRPALCLSTRWRRAWVATSAPRWWSCTSPPSQTTVTTSPAGRRPTRYLAEAKPMLPLRSTFRVAVGAAGAPSATASTSTSGSTGSTAARRNRSQGATMPMPWCGRWWS